MALLVRWFPKCQLNFNGVKQAPHKFFHLSSISNTSKDYYEIKLKPFVEQPIRPYEKWRRRQHYPHHVENIKWRMEQGLPVFMNQTGPLTDRPDYSYVHESLNRPHTYGVGQKRRMLEQIELAKTIVQYCAEMDHGKQKYQDKLKAAEQEKQNLLKNKFIPKGTDIF